MELQSKTDKLMKTDIPTILSHLLEIVNRKKINV